MTHPADAVIRAGVVAVVSALLLVGCSSSEDARPASVAEDLDDALSQREITVDPLYDEIVGERSAPGEAGMLVLPGQTLRIDSVTIAPTLDDPETGEEVRAPDGKRFAAITLTRIPEQDPGFTIPDAEVAIEDEGVRTSLQGWEDDAQSVLVTVSDDARIVVAVDGHDVEAEAVTGRWLPDPVTEVLQDPSTRQDLAELVIFDDVQVTHPNGRGTAQFSTTVRSARLTPYLPAELTGGAGRWSPEGSTYLLVETVGDKAGSGMSTEWGVIETVQSWSADIDGVTYENTSDVVFGSMFGGDRETMVMEVPADTRGDLSLEVAARSVIRMNGESNRELDHGRRQVPVTLGRSEALR